MFRGLSLRGRSPSTSSRKDDTLVSKSKANETSGKTTTINNIDIGSFKLKVKVLEARGLRIADKKTKSSDPFVEIKVANHKVKTKVKEKTLKPKWDEVFEFGATTGKKKAKTLTMDDHVLIHVLDRDFVFNDDLGGALVSLADVFAADGKKIHKWIPLRPYVDVVEEMNVSKKANKKKSKKKAEEFGGEILLSLRLMDADEEEDEEQDNSGSSEDEHEEEDDEIVKGKKLHETKEVTKAKAIPKEDSATKPIALVVKIIQAKDVRAADRNGKSDPYVIAQFGKRKKQTKVVKKTLNPKWDQEFEFAATDKKGNLIESELMVRVYDDDIIGDDFLGQISVPYKELQTMQESETTWYALESTGKKKTKPVTGEIQLSIQYKHGMVDEAAVPDTPRKSKKSRFSLRSLSPLRRKPTTEDSPRSPTSPDNETHLDTVHDNEIEHEGAEEPKKVPSFTIKLIAGRGLRSADRNNLSDPYCVVRLGKEKFTSITKSRTLDPEWNESKQFGASEKLRNRWNWDMVLKVDVKDYDSYLTSDMLGTIDIPLKNLYDNKGKAKWYDLVDPRAASKKKRKNNQGPEEELELGSIQLQVDFHEEMEENATSPASVAATTTTDITIRVVEAQGLKATDRGNLCDPYCVISFKDGKQKQRKQQTKVIQNTLNPKWDQELKLSNLSTKPDSEILIKVMDKDIITSDLVGKMSIKVRDILAVKGEQQWVPLDPCGKICIQASGGEGVEAHDDAIATEFDNILTHIQKQLAKNGNSKVALKNVFKLSDKDNSGMVDREELKHLLSLLKLSQGLEEKDVDFLLDCLDENKDGQIVFEELEMLLNDTSEAATPSSPGSPLLSPSSSDGSTVANLNNVLQKLVQSAVDQRIDPLVRHLMRHHASPSEMVEDFVSDMKKNFDLLDEDDTGLIEVGKRLNRVLNLSKSVSIHDESENRALLEAFGENKSSNKIKYMELCEKLLDRSYINGLVSRASASDSEDEPEVATPRTTKSEVDMGVPSEPEVQKQTKLVVRIIRAAGLRAADRSGKSDPYCVIKLGNETVKTKVMKRTLDPEWNEEFTLGNKKSGVKPDAVLKVLIKDKDLVFSDLLGQLNIPVAEIVHNTVVENWYDVIGGKGKTKAEGKLLMGVALQVPKVGKLNVSVPLSKVDDYVEGMEFESVAGSPNSMMGSIKSGMSSPSSVDAKWHNKQLMEIRELVAKAIRANGGDTSLRSELERLDVRCNGYLSSRRLQSGLESYGIRLTAAQMGTLLPRIDPEGVDRCDYGLLCKIVRADVMYSTHKSKAASVQTIRSRVNRVLTRAHAKKTQFAALFYAFDPSRTGTVTDHDCCSVLRAIGGDFQPQEIHLLAQHIPGAEQNGYIRYKTFLKGVCTSIDFSECFSSWVVGGGNAGPGQVGPMDGSLNGSGDIMTKFKKLVQKSSKNAGGIDFARAFEQLDESGDGKISRRAFRSFISTMINENLPPSEKLNEQDIQGVMERLDTNGDGLLDYIEFTEMLSMSKEELEKSSERFRKRLVVHHRQRQTNADPSLLAAFSARDKQGDGSISRRDFRATLESLGEGATLNGEEFRHLMNKFDKLGTGSIDYNDFVAWVHGEPAPSLKREIEPYEVDRILRNNILDDQHSHHRDPRNQTQYKMRDDFQAHPSSGGLFEKSLQTIDRMGSHDDEGEVSIWHPKTVSEWLDRYATPAERSDFDEIYRSVSEYSHIGRPRQQRSPSPTRRGHILSNIHSPSSPSRRSWSFEHTRHRSPSPMDRDCKMVGWECRFCGHENRSLAGLNNCTKCGGIRSASARVIIHNKHKNLSSSSSYTSSDSGSSEDEINYHRKGSPSSRSKNRSGRSRTRQRNKMHHESSSDSDSASSNSLDEEDVVNRRRSRRHRKSKRASPLRLRLVDDFNDDNSSESSNEDDDASDLHSGVFGDDYWSSVSRQKHSKYGKTEKKKKHHHKSSKRSSSKKRSRSKSRTRSHHYRSRSKSRSKSKSKSWRKPLL